MQSATDGAATTTARANGDGVSLTIRDAARATGLSVKAIQRRIERGSLEARLVDGVRRIPLRVLVEAGLLVRDPAQAPRRPPPVDVAALARRVERLEARLAELEGRVG